jgi:amino acid transporter/mannitol/fructose-specific phosphotransferase system IIA component (Ntr-type)
MKLKKELGFLDIFSIAAGAMISSGIFILPGLAFKNAGPAVFLGYFLAGALALLGTLNVIELSTAMPKAGGDYYFVSRSLGPLMGTISGFLSWFALSLKSAFAIFGLAEILYLLSGFDITFIGVILCTFFVLLNIVGVKAAGKIEIYLVLGLLILMAFYIVLGIPAMRIERFTPFTPYGLNSIFFTAGFVFVSFGGLLNIASISEEVKNPKKNIPAGILSALIVVTLLYTFILMVTVGVSSADKLAGSLTPIADGARNFVGETGAILMGVAAALAFITTANAGILSASRYPLALSRDSLLPQFINRISSGTKTPVFSIVLTGIFIALALFLPLEILVKAASTVILTSYVLASVAVIILRESKIFHYQPSFRTPFYPWVQIAGILLFSFLIADMGYESIEISLGLLALSAGVYFFYGRKKSIRDFALLYLIERITDRKLTSSHLEEELISVLYQRDDIIQDRFDRNIQDSLVLDLEESMTYEEMFKVLTPEIAEKVGVASDKLFQQLMEREIMGNTVISPFVAIPHIVLDKENTFQIILVRNRKGVFFSQITPAVKAVFIIMGSPEFRKFHLKSLMAIAQTVKYRGFEKRWLSTQKKEHLKDIFLLTPREREKAAGESREES